MRYRRSIELFESIGLDINNKDELFLHTLEVIGATACILDGDPRFVILDATEIEHAKRRIFWKTVKEIATLQLTDEIDDDFRENEISLAGNLLAAFPDNDKKTDGRMWLPISWIVSRQLVSHMDHTVCRLCRVIWP